MPLFYPNVFATSRYRNKGRSPRTIAKLLRTLGMLAAWGRSRGRDIDADLVGGWFPDAQEVNNLFVWLSKTAEGQHAELAADATGRKTLEVTKLESLRPLAWKPDHRPAPGAHPAELAIRLRWVASYFEFHLGLRVQEMTRAKKDATAFKESAEISLATLRDLAPSSSDRIEDESHEGLSASVVEDLEGLLQPDNEDNPWESEFVRWRNYLMWRIFADTGARRGEVSELQVSDVSSSMLRVHFMSSKTIARTNALKPITGEVFDHFLFEFYQGIPAKNRRHRYLFTSEQGRHLTKRQVNRIFEEIRNTSGVEVPQHLTPRTMRRTWNDRYNETIDKARASGEEVTSQRELETRNRLQGWSSTSQMGSRYGRRSIRESSDALAQRGLDRVEAAVGKKRERDP